MKAFLTSYIPARSIQRITGALAAAAPAGVELVETREAADLCIYVVIGEAGVGEIIAEDVAAGRQYAISQSCYLGTARPGFWEPLWLGARGVYGYMDLPVLPGTRFLLAPHGVDPALFSRADYYVPRDITMISTGYVAQSEAVVAVAEAVRRVNGRHVHIGARFDLGPIGSNTTFVHDVSDEALRNLYRHARFVAGLRRGEGFELPAAEGLLCGARPIVFDTPCYRRWYAPWARFVAEEDENGVADALEQIFRTDTDAVTPEESAAAAALFHWPTIFGAFWQMLLQP